MNDTAIQVEHLSKLYRIGALQSHNTLRDQIVYGVRGLFQRNGRNRPESNTIWALKDVSFKVKRGEVIGIIGRNGAGKSTLLKILSRITGPTSGQAKIYGRVGSLLEVGTGFHSELTGRENVFLNGAVLGMTKAEIKRKFDEIVAFSEVEKFLDTPVKHYSSGMYVRLAFAVAAHLETETLIVDEVLAVGDLEFQRKCLGKMSQVAGEGRTVLLVSHNMTSIRKLCETGLLLESGRVVYSGPIKKCIDCYVEDRWVKTGDILGHATMIEPAISMESVRINGSTSDQQVLAAGQSELIVEMDFDLHRSARVELEARVSDTSETPLAFYSPGHVSGDLPRLPAGKHSMRWNIVFPNLTRGDYRLDLFLTDPDHTGWVDIPGAARIQTEGTSLATGRTFNYTDGRGWVMLGGAQL